MIQLQRPDPRSLHPPTRTQRACSIWRAPVPAGSKRALPLFVRSSCSGQTLDRFTSTNEHKDRVLLWRFQRLSSLNGHFRFSDPAAQAKSSGCFAQSNETKCVSVSWAPTSCGFKQACSAFRDPAAVARLSTASPPQMNTKTVFFCGGSSACRV